MNQVLPLKHDQDYFSDLGFPYFDPIDEYLSLWDDVELPLLSNNDENSGDQSNIVAKGGGDEGGRSGWRRTTPLELEEIEKHFEMPITLAAQKMKVGLTMLKKRCRELNIKRWPHRKLKSIKSLMQNVKVSSFLYILPFFFTLLMHNIFFFKIKVSGLGCVKWI